jgi:hypothetical protein
VNIECMHIYHYCGFCGRRGTVESGVLDKESPERGHADCDRRQICS